MSNTRVCSKCKEEKSVLDFNKNKTIKGGLRYECKACAKKYYEENKEAIAKSHKKYREGNKEAIAEYSRKHYEENKEAINKRTKKYYGENREAISKRRGKNRKTTNGRASLLLHSMKKRAKKKGWEEPEFTTEDIETIISESTCAITGRSFSLNNKTKYTKDPFAPSPDRKDNSKGYTKANVQWVCSWINIARGELSMRMFKKLTKELPWLKEKK